MTAAFRATMWVCSSCWKAHNTQWEAEICCTEIKKEGEDEQSK